MSRQVRWVAVALAAVASAPGPPAFADSPARPASYTRAVPGGRCVFVMLAPRAVEDEVLGWDEATAADIRAVRRTYARSGLYRVGEAGAPLWTVDWYAHRVDAASDGVHLVRHGRWASSTDDEAVSFFAGGELLRTYRIRELVDRPDRLERSVSHFFWRAEGHFDDARLEYALTTKDDNRFVFDARTGEVASEARSGRSVTWGAAGCLGAAVLAAVLAAVAWMLAKRRRHAGRARPT